MFTAEKRTNNYCAKKGQSPSSREVFFLLSPMFPFPGLRDLKKGTIVGVCHALTNVRQHTQEGREGWMELQVEYLVQLGKTRRGEARLEEGKGKQDSLTLLLSLAFLSLHNLHGWGGIPLQFCLLHWSPLYKLPTQVR